MAGSRRSSQAPSTPSRPPEAEQATQPAPRSPRTVFAQSLRRHAGRLAVGWLLLAVHQAAEAAVPIAIGVIIDRAVSAGDPTALAWSVASLAALFAVLALAWRNGARQGVTSLEREAHQLRVDVARTALDPRGRRTGLRTGELLAVASSDAQKTALIIRAVSLGIGALCAIVVSSVALLVIDVPLGLGVLAGVTLSVLLNARVSPRLTRHSAALQKATGQATAMAADLLGGVRTLRGIGARSAALERYREAGDAALRAGLRAATTTGLHQGVTVAGSGLFLAGVAGFAGWAALTGRLTVGQLVTVTGLAQFLAEPLRTLGFCGRIAAGARASARRWAGVVDAAPQVSAGTLAAVRESADLTLRRVRYRTLDGLDLHAAHGRLTAVVAYDPRDADALLAVVSGQASAHEGEVLVAGVPAGELTLDAMRRTVHVEQHDVALFEGSVRENLTAGREHGQAPVAAAVTAAAADDIVALHSAGLDHQVTERGASLSGGQRQRIALARALLAAPPVLVLHEPTTAVDAVTEEVIAHRLADHRRGHCTVVITSSPALLARADQVVVIEDGRATRTGTHTRLAASDAGYRKAVLR
ncbi:ABC transporter transmembrane domain-containing protein [Streptomyces reniochalinae]|uniref:ABC transporter ATP-binding protein n=1 Tax=Streptomyces reniochalinae TaxID=2250578 RepID=A0A367EQC8_9ACTN|nr:ABC transporter ATP-binding protein [Streptomyces reniochalinae]RCG20316.1 ABC transporter ATP-binding protein [Streptomyces reniochalinae]